MRYNPRGGGVARSGRTGTGHSISGIVVYSSIYDDFRLFVLKISW
jgi:hypothetical protein